MVLTIIVIVLCVLGFPLAVGMAYILEPKPVTAAPPPASKPSPNIWARRSLATRVAAS